MQFENIQNLTLQYSYTMLGNAARMTDVMFEMWGAPALDSSFDQTSSEIIMQLHNFPDWLPPTDFVYSDASSNYYGDVKVSSMQDVATHSHTLVTAFTDNDSTSGTLNFATFIKELMWRGIINGNEFTYGVEFGPEVVGGQGGLQVNSLSVAITMKQEVHGSGAIQAGAIGTNHIVGSAGGDTVVYEGQMSSFDIKPINGGLMIRAHNDSSTLDVLDGVERLQFTDKTLAFDIDGNAGQAYRLYQAAFDRVPDQAGLGYWIDQMDGGMGLSQVATGFINSAEFKSLYGNNPSNSAFVTLLYDNVLHRAPDTAGFDYWMNELSHGVSREQALIGFSESTENKVSLMAFSMDGNMGKDYRLYQAAFDRKPDVSGLDYWYHQLNSGMSLEQVASGFINSTEFKTLYGNNPSNAELVTLLYDNVLHRAPDTAGFNYWMNELDHGTSREQALIGFSESLENQLSLVGIVQTGIEFV